MAEEECEESDVSDIEVQSTLVSYCVQLRVTGVGEGRGGRGE